MSGLPRRPLSRPSTPGRSSRRRRLPRGMIGGWFRLSPRRPRSRRRTSSPSAHPSVGTTRAEDDGIGPARDGTGSRAAARAARSLRMASSSEVASCPGARRRPSRPPVSSVRGRAPAIAATGVGRRRSTGLGRTVEERGERASRSRASVSRAARSRPRAPPPRQPRAEIASTSWRWYAFRSFRPSRVRPVRSCGGPGHRSHSTPPSGGTQRKRPSASRTAVALDAAVDLGPHAELVGEVHLEPAGDAAGRHPGVEQLVAALEQRVDRLGGVALLERPVGELGEVPGGRRALERVAQVQPGVADGDLGDDVEGPAARQQRRSARRTAPASRRSATSGGGCPWRSP